MRSERERRTHRLRVLAPKVTAGIALVGAVSVVVAWRLQLLNL
jgi:hypothetical protein